MEESDYTPTVRMSGVFYVNSLTFELNVTRACFVFEIALEIILFPIL